MVRENTSKKKTRVNCRKRVNIYVCEYVVTIFTLDGRKPCSMRSEVPTSPICWMRRPVTPPLVFEGGVAREEPPLVEQPRRILSGKIGLFGSGQIGP